jgi:adenylosuccinate lyase
LTNSASARFVAEYLAGFAMAVDRMRSVLRSLKVDRARMAENISRSGDLLFSESVYVLAALGGDPDAHERIRLATLEAERTGARLVDVLRKDTALWDVLSRQLAAARGTDSESFFSDPSYYAGIAADRARAIADTHARNINALRRELVT